MSTCAKDVFISLSFSLSDVALIAVSNSSIISWSFFFNIRKYLKSYQDKCKKFEFCPFFSFWMRAEDSFVSGKFRVNLWICTTQHIQQRPKRNKIDCRISTCSAAAFHAWFLSRFYFSFHMTNGRNEHNI